MTESPKDDKGNVLEYFDSNEAAMENLKAIVMDENWLKSLQFYVNFRYINCGLILAIMHYVFRHTGVLQSLHTLMLVLKEFISSNNSKTIIYKFTNISQ